MFTIQIIITKLSNTYQIHLDLDRLSIHSYAVVFHLPFGGKLHDPPPPPPKHLASRLEVDRNRKSMEAAAT